MTSNILVTLIFVLFFLWLIFNYKKKNKVLNDKSQLGDIQNTNASYIFPETVNKNNGELPPKPVEWPKHVTAEQEPIEFGDKIPLTIGTTQPTSELSIEDADDYKQNELLKQFGTYDHKLELASYKYPPLDLLENYGLNKITISSEELETNKTRIVETLNRNNIEINKIKATIGPVFTLYEIIPAAGRNIVSKIKDLENEIAFSLANPGVTIAPMPSRGTIGIPVPNQNPEIVSMRSVLATEKFQNTDMDLPIALGKTLSNEVFIADLAKMPHLLIVGAVEKGKTNSIYVILVSLLYKKHPSEIKFILIDPKKVEFNGFRKIERHFLAKLPDEADSIITDSKKVLDTLISLCIEMDQRYDLLKDARVRNIKEYNQKFIQRKISDPEKHRHLPYIVLAIDEFAELIMTTSKDILTPIIRLAQQAHQIGIHLIITTQRVLPDAITSAIKSCFPSKLAFHLLSKVDSRTILDIDGAEKLICQGDMLLSTGTDLVRLQCAFVDTHEIERISDFIGNQQGYSTAFLLPEYAGDGETSSSKEFDADNRDPMFEEAARLIVMHQQGSTSLIQRKLKLGYNRAGRIIDQLEAAGIVGPFEGSKARDVLYQDEYSLERHLENLSKPI